MKELHETNSGYLKDILDDEEERLVSVLSDKLSSDDKYLFFRYVALRDIMQKIRTV